MLSLHYFDHLLLIIVTVKRWPRFLPGCWPVLSQFLAVPASPQAAHGNPERAEQPQVQVFHSLTLSVTSFFFFLVSSYLYSAVENRSLGPAHTQGGEGRHRRCKHQKMGWGGASRKLPATDIQLVIISSISIYIGWKISEVIFKNVWEDG